MAGFGEVIHGHYGQYITKQYGTASETEVKEFFLKNMETGEQDSCNYTVFFGTQKLSGYLWAGFASSVGAQGSRAGYQHVVYQKNTLSGMHDGEKILAFPFMSARQCMEYLGNQKEFTGETRRPLIESLNADRQQADVEISVDRKLLGDIACYCVGKTRTNSREFLKILVPPETEDYQGYCLAMIRMILRAIPCGLRTNLSFATNAPDMKYKFFGILFKRDEGEQGSGYVRANGDFDQTFLRGIYLEEPVGKIIRACAFDDTLAEACYRDMERALDAEGKLNASCYGDYYTLYKLQEEPFCLEYLRKLNKLFISVETEWKRKQIENVLLERAPNVRNVEDTVAQSGEYKNAKELKEVLEILDSIGGILAYYRGKGQDLSNEFVNGMLKKVLCWSSEKETEASLQILQPYGKELEKFLGNRVKKVQGCLAKIYKAQLKKRLTDTILCNPAGEVVRNVFEEAKGFGDNFYKEFSGTICNKIRQARDRNSLEDQDLYELYFKLVPYVQMIDEDYRIFAKDYTKAIYEKRIWEIPSSNNVELYCRDMEEKFPEELEHSLNGLVEHVLLPRYSNMDTKALEGYHIEETMVLLKRYSGSGRVNESLEFRYRLYQIEKLKANLMESPSAKDMQRLFILVKKIMPETLTEVKHYALQCVSRSFDCYRKTGTDPEKYPELFAYLCDIREAVLKMIPDAEQRWPQDYMFFNGKFESCFNKCLLRYANLDFTLDRIREVLEFSKKLLNRRQFYRDLSAEIKKNYQDGRISKEEVTRIYQYMEVAAGSKKALQFRDDTERMEEDREEDKEEDTKEKYGEEYYSSENGDRKRAEREKIRRRQQANRRLILLMAACAAVIVVGIAAAVVLSSKDKNPEIVQPPVKETENEDNFGNGDGVEPPVGKMSKVMANSILEEAAELWISEESYTQAVTEFKSVDVLDIVDFMKQQESDGHQAQAVREYLAFSIMEEINKETPDKDYEIVNVDFYDVSGFQDMKPLAQECPAVLILTVKDESGNKNKIYYYNKEEKGFVDYGINPNGMDDDETELREKIKADIEPIITTRTAHVQDAMAASESEAPQAE